MKRISYIEFQMTDSGMEEVFRDDHVYEGTWEHCGGGPSAAQNRAADANAVLSGKLGEAADRAQAFKEAQQAKVDPFYTQRLKQGSPLTPMLLDYAGGLNARANAPAKAALLKRIGTSTGLPSGSRDQALTDFDASRARSYDDSLTGTLAADDQTKQAAASGLLGQAQLADPMGYYSGALQGNSSIMNANLRKPGFMGAIGGLLGGAASSFAG